MAKIQHHPLFVPDEIPHSQEKPTFKTTLSPAEEIRFKEWAKTNAPDSDHPLSKYDYRGFYKENSNFNRGPEEHLTDKFKQPGHPTFSNESQYAAGRDDAGSWDGETFISPNDKKKHHPHFVPDEQPNQHTATSEEFAPFNLYNEAKKIYEHPLTQRILSGPTKEEIGLPEENEIAGPGLMEIPGVRRGASKLANLIDNPQGEGSYLRGAAAGTLEGLGGIAAQGADPRTVYPGKAGSEFGQSKPRYTYDTGTPKGQRLLESGTVEGEVVPSIKQPRMLEKPYFEEWQIPDKYSMGVEKPYRAEDSFSTAEGDSPRATETFNRQTRMRHGNPSNVRMLESARKEFPIAERSVESNELDALDSFQNERYSDIARESQLPVRNDIVPGRAKSLAERMTGIRDDSPIDWGPKEALTGEVIQPESHMEKWWRDSGLNDYFELPMKNVTSEPKPTATYRRMQETGLPQDEMADFPIYDIKGGSSDGSTVDADHLRRLGIDVPEHQIAKIESSVTKLEHHPSFVPDQAAVGEPVESNQSKSVQDILSPKSTDTMQKMFDENNPVFKKLQESGEFSRGEEKPAQINPFTKKPVETAVKTPEVVKPIDDLLFNKEGHAIYSAERVQKELGLTPKEATAKGYVQPVEDSNGVRGYRLIPNTEGKASQTLIQHLKNEEGSAQITRGKKPPKKSVSDKTTEQPEQTEQSTQQQSAVTKLLSALEHAKGKSTEQAAKLKIERARRFAEFEGVKSEGVEGAAKSLGKLKGEYEKVTLPEGMDLSDVEVNSLFTTVKRANITTGEKARGYTTLFKLLEGGDVPARSELKVLDDVFGNGFAERIIELHGGLGAVSINIAKTANTMKAMMSSFDLSAPLRQGAGLVHRPEWREASIEMLKFFAKPQYFNAAMKAIEFDPYYIVSREAGLFIAKPDNLMAGEEAFMNSYVSNLPDKFTGGFGLGAVKQGVEASERAYIGFLNYVRFNTFKNLMIEARAFDAIDMVNEDGKFVLNKQGQRERHLVSNQITRNLAKYVNISTGRGSLGRLEPIAAELNTIIWSPKFLTARLTALNPAYYYKLDSFTRKQAVKSLFAIAGMSTVLRSLAYLAGATATYNILSSDFAKSRFKDNKVVDPNAGFQQPIVAAARMINETQRMAKGKRKVFNAPGIPEIASNFMRNKESPMASLIDSIVSSKQFTGDGGYTDRFGNKTSVQREAAMRFAPIFAQDVIDVHKSNPTFAEAIGLDVASLLGVGVQDYPQDRNARKSNPSNQRELVP